MKIVLDAFGGDYAPDEMVLGAVKALQANEKLQIVLVGDKDAISALMQKYIFVSDRLEIVHAPDVISTEENPVMAVKTKRTSSLVVSFDFLKKNEDACALVTAGSTGATLVAAISKLGKMKSVSKPALAPMLPSVNDKGVLLLDSGANADCKPDDLLNFALMGNEYMKALGVNKPKVGLLNISTSEDSGNEVAVETYRLLKKSNINFIGNIESRDVLKGMVDIVVTDGYTGNIFLKSIEGTAEVLFEEIKCLSNKNIKTKIASGLLKRDWQKLQEKYHYKHLGGAPLLGVNKIVLKCHGNSKAETIALTIEKAWSLATNNLIKKVKKVVANEK